jgi:hypothetical protein
VNGVASGDPSVGTIQPPPNGIYGEFVYAAPAVTPIAGNAITLTVISPADTTNSSQLALTLQLAGPPSLSDTPTIAARVFRLDQQTPPRRESLWNADRANRVQNRSTRNLGRTVTQLSPKGGSYAEEE